MACTQPQLPAERAGMDNGLNTTPAPIHRPCPIERGSSAPLLPGKPLATAPAVHLLSNNHPQSSTVLVKGCDSPPQARAPHHGISPPSSAPTARDGREIRFTKGSFICGTIREQGWDPSRRQESDLPADGFIISQAQQFGLNETKPLPLMKTSLMRRASKGGRGSFMNGVSPVLQGWRNPPMSRLLRREAQLQLGHMDPIQPGRNQSLLQGPNLLMSWLPKL